MAVGTLIAESLQVDAAIDGVRLVVTKVAGRRRRRRGRSAADVDLHRVRGVRRGRRRVARSLETGLRREGGWYCDFRTDAETFVVFAGRTFRYARGDAAGRADATSYGRSVGVPEAQLDWPR